MGLLAFALNITLDGCYDRREGVADDELHDSFTQLMDAGEAISLRSQWQELAQAA